MSKSNVNGPEGRETIEDPVTELLRVGAQQLIQRAVEAELAELLSQHGGRRTETGNAGVGISTASHEDQHGCYELLSKDPLKPCSTCARVIVKSGV